MSPFVPWRQTQWSLHHACRPSQGPMEDIMTQFSSLCRTLFKRLAPRGPHTSQGIAWRNLDSNLPGHVRCKDPLYSDAYWRHGLRLAAFKPCEDMQISTRISYYLCPAQLSGEGLWVENSVKAPPYHTCPGETNNRQALESLSYTSCSDIASLGAG